MDKKTTPCGQYLLGKTIGEGTFGKVKLGTHILTGERVAVKILERDRVKEVADVERVAREIRILKIIRHPHIIKLYEIIETPHALFLIMEYCSGGELFDHIVESGRVPETRACRFFHQILSGVEQIHKINVVHRDLKPENLLLDENSSVKIVDFGLSNMYKDGELLKTACGSPCYASPEMIAGSRYVPSGCDIWSCGVIIFAVICGYLPFEDQNTNELYRKIVHAQYTAPNFISEQARDLIKRILQTDPEKRITLEQIKEHPWYTQIPYAASAWVPKSLTCDGGAHGPEEIDEDVLEQLVELEFPREHALECLRENKHNQVTTTYYLLVEKKRKVVEAAARTPRNGSKKSESGDGKGRGKKKNNNAAKGATLSRSDEKEAKRAGRGKGKNASKGAWTEEDVPGSQQNGSSRAEKSAEKASTKAAGKGKSPKGQYSPRGDAKASPRKGAAKGKGKSKRDNWTDAGKGAARHGKAYGKAHGREEDLWSSDGWGLQPQWQHENWNAWESGHSWDDGWATGGGKHGSWNDGWYSHSDAAGSRWKGSSSRNAASQWSAW
eukprot:TRINITY_DN41144_c0_g2_i3.p1 TRINITY_DN41144_c0_g2~~TRINITY_DN41144_c0_g2_i3.p1  ORF type:complete len:554 (-),score=95.47 TRINITY_DN41144_c0_g2_i3:6-1667(-)